MYDIELVKEILHQLLWSAQTIARRFASVTSPEDFVVSEEGLEKLDAICMQLIAMMLRLCTRFVKAISRNLFGPSNACSQN